MVLQCMKNPQELYNWCITEMARYSALRQIEEVQKNTFLVQKYSGNIEALAEVAKKLVIYFGCHEMGGISGG